MTSAKEMIAKMKSDAQAEVDQFDALSTQMDADLKSATDGGFDQGVAQNTTPGDKIYTEADLQGEIKPLKDQIAKLQADAAAAAAAPAPADTTPFSQADMDKATADSTAAVASMKAELDAMTKKEQLEEQAVSGMYSSIDKVQASLDNLKAVSQSLQPVAPAAGSDTGSTTAPAAPAVDDGAATVTKPSSRPTLK